MPSGGALRSKVRSSAIGAPDADRIPPRPSLRERGEGRGLHYGFGQGFAAFRLDHRRLPLFQNQLKERAAAVKPAPIRIMMNEHPEALPPKRPPAERAEPRMEALATLPVFWKLDGKRVLLAGGGAGAAWKAELLAATGAHVHVIAEEIGAEMHALAASVYGPQLTVEARHWTPDDLGGAALAIGDVEEEEEAELFRDAAKAAGVPVNVVDKPAFCDFQFGSIVNRSPLIISISTDGAAPVFGQEIRSQIEAMLPAGFKLWARAAKAWRHFVEEKEWPFRLRRAFWQRFNRRSAEIA